jgi:putative PIN family toxin of toxin-antitoxin system
MNVVVDANVLVSGILKPFSPSGEIVRMLAAGTLSLYLDARILDEYAEVLNRPKFQFDPRLVACLLNQIEHHGALIAGLPISIALPDPDDLPFLEVAVAGGAECLVTGNLGHFPAPARRRVKVLSPKQFMDSYRHRFR